MPRCDPKKTENMRDKNRREYPVTARMLDEFRHHFGADVKLIYSDLDGKAIGKKLPASRRFVMVNDWLATGARIARNKALDERKKR